MKLLGVAAGVLVGGFLLLALLGSTMPSLEERVAEAQAKGWRSVDLYASDRAAVRDGMADVLKDPSSARYGTFFGYLDEKGRVIVCGTVNARNSFGGYVGEAAFYGLLVRSVFAPLMIDSSASHTAQTTCLENLSISSQALLDSANAR